MIESNNTELNTHIRWYESGFWETRINMVLKQIEDCKGMKLLDLGCGIGTFSMEAAKRGAGVTAVDSFNEAIRVCQKLVKKYNLSEKISIVRANALNLPFLSDSFDIVIAADIIEHTAEPSRLLDEVRRVGKANSLVICTTKNASSLHLFVGYLIHRDKSMILRGLESLYRIFKSNENPKKTEKLNPSFTYVGHVNEYDPIRLRIEFKRRGFKVLYHASYSWNWRSEWKNLNRIFKPFFCSLIFKRIQDKFLGLFLGHDQILVVRNEKWSK